jgi:anti-sigma factor RsiW
MKLVEAESTGPVEGEDAVITAPRPPHRRVSVSLLFTLTVLIGTVVAIYSIFPARHNVFVTEAIARHREATTTWDLVEPTPTELRAWAIGVAGKDVPLPAASATVVGARKLKVNDRNTAMIRLRVGDDEISYLVQHMPGIAPDHVVREDGDLRAVAWTKGPFACIAVGPRASAKQWLKVVGGS